MSADFHLSECMNHWGKTKVTEYWKIWKEGRKRAQLLLNEILSPLF